MILSTSLVVRPSSTSLQIINGSVDVTLRAETAEALDQWETAIRDAVHRLRNPSGSFSDTFSSDTARAKDCGLEEFASMRGHGERKNSTNEKDGVLLMRGGMVHYWRERIFSLRDGVLFVYKVDELLIAGQPTTIIRALDGV